MGARLPFPWRLAAVFLLLTLGIGLAGGVYYFKQREDLRRDKLDELAAIADLKTRQITAWRAERLAEAESIHATSFIVAHARHWLEGGSRDAAEKEALLAWMKAPRHARHYRCVFLFDTRGEVRLASDPQRTLPCANSQPAVQAALDSGAVQFLDFHRAADGERIHLSLFVPLAENGKAIGVLGFEIDPDNFLYPLVETWPTPSPSAESLLVRREGDEVVFLNRLRHSTDKALARHIPLSQADVPAVRAANGEQGAFAGHDYRGVAVLAALRQIPDSPWAMVSKIDLDEVDAPLRARAVILAGGMAALIGVAAFAVLLLWRQQQMRFELARLAAEDDALHRANLGLEQRVAERTHELQATAQNLQHEIELHRVAEDALKDSLEELSRSNADLEQFAYIASHDLQEPLRMVASYVQLLARRYRDRLDDDARDFIGYAVEGVTRMQRLINDMLNYALVGIDALEFEETDCNAVLAEVLMNLKPLIEEHHASVSQDILPCVAASHSQLGQLLQNLIVNAIKFHGEAPPQIHVGARQLDKEWEFSVSDNGIGIEAEYFESIFLIFKRLHSREEYAGTGIGLAICKRIVERHHGRIWVESTAGQGATFRFTIPARMENAT